MLVAGWSTEVFLKNNEKDKSLEATRQDSY